MKVTYDQQLTALVMIDPYNDFLSEGGKRWDRLRAVAEANSCIPHMLQVLNAARKAALRGFYALHHRYRQGDYETWKYIAPIQKAAWVGKTICGSDPRLPRRVHDRGTTGTDTYAASPSALKLSEFYNDEAKLGLHQVGGDDAQGSSSKADLSLRS